MNKYEIIGHEIRENQVIKTATQTVVNKPGVAKVQKFALAAVGKLVNVTHYQRTTDGQEIFEQVAAFVPVIIRISGGVEPIEQALDQDTFVLEGSPGLKVKVETVEELAENAILEVVLQ